MKNKASIICHFQTITSGLFLSTHDRNICLKKNYEIHKVCNLYFYDSFLLMIVKKLFGKSLNKRMKKFLSKDGIDYENIPIKKKLIHVMLEKIFPDFNFYNSVEKKISSLVTTMHNDFTQSNLIMSHWLFPSSFFAMKLSEKINKPFFTTFHGSDINMFKKNKVNIKVAERILRKASVNFFVSSALLKTANEIFGYKFNGYVSKNSILKDSIQTFKKQKKIYDVCYIGNLLPIKGADRLIKIFHDLQSSTNKSLKIAVVGEGECKKEMVLASKELNINFTGSMPREKCLEILASSKVAILPSRDEGLPLIAIESIALKTPMICTNVGGCQEIIHKSWLVENNSDLINQFIKKISAILLFGDSKYEFQNINFLDEVIAEDVKVMQSNLRDGN